MFQFVFENLCKSRNLDPSKYELCHSNKILDLRQNISLCGLGNNSTLIIRPITKRRDQSLVTVCLQLETGERQIGEFTNEQTLYDIVSTLFPKKLLDNDAEISCVYMRTEVSGIDKLKETKLSTLGILTGKVAIKLKIASLNVLSASSSQPSKFSKFTKDLDQKVSSVSSSLAGKIEMLKQKLAAKKKKNNVEGTENQSVTNVLETESNRPSYAVQDDLIELEVNGHKVVLFSLDDKQRLTNGQEITDDFFEITKEDLKLMHRDLQTKKAELEERPLETQKLREQRVVKEEKKYEFTIIRLQFPFDHLILQTTFKPTDSIEQLINLVKELVDVNDFYLYTAPPKKVLDNQNTFFKEKLVPAAVVQFGGHQKCVLNEELKQNISSFINVVSYTDNLRNELRNQRQQNTEQTEAANNQNSAQLEATNRVKKEEKLMKLLNMKK